MLQTLAKIYLKAEEAEQAENIIEQAMKLADEQKETVTPVTTGLSIWLWSQGRLKNGCL